VAVSISLDPSSGSGLCLEDDGCYWFLYHYLERASQQTGRMVDPYGDAAFSPIHLDALLTALEATATDAERWTEDRAVRVGWRGTQEVFDKVSKQRLTDLIGEFIYLVEMAKLPGAKIICIGN